MATAPVAGLSALQTASETFSSIQLRRIESDFARQQLELNRQMAEVQAKDAIARGEREAEAMRGRTKRLIGSQRAALAAQGIDIKTGTALEVQQETAALSAVDELTIRNNAMREAFGFRAQALSFGGQAAFTGLFANIAQRQTLATGGARFAKELASFGFSEDFRTFSRTRTAPPRPAGTFASERSPRGPLP